MSRSPLTLLSLAGCLAFAAPAAASDVNTSFEFTNLSGQFTLGTFPHEAHFTNGLALSIGDLSLYTSGFNAWMVPVGSVGTIVFPATMESVDFFLRDQFGSANQGICKVFDWDGNVVSMNVSTNANWTHITAGSPGVRIKSIELDNVLGNGFSVIDDFEACVGPLLGSNYCSSTAICQAQGAKISVTGSTSVSLNEFEMIAGPVPNGGPGLFFRGTAQIAAPFGNGTRCVGGSVYRMGVATAFGTDDPLVLRADLSVMPSGGEFLANGTWNFQCWFRDVGCAAGFNLSDGIEVTFSP